MTSRPPLRERTVLLLMGGAVILGLLVLGGVTARGPRWLVRYTLTEGSTSGPMVFAGRDVRLDNLLSPLPRALRDTDRFAAVFESDLIMDTQAQTVLMLTSRGASRLLVDGKPVIRNAGVPLRQTRGAALMLSKGMHRLRVEYKAPEGEKYLALIGSLDGKPPRPLPAARLRRPR